MTQDIRDVLKLALEALESCDAAHITDGGHQWYDEKLVDKAITAIKEALAHCPDCGQLLGDAGHIHTCSPQSTWVGLTEDDKVLIKHDANFNQFMTAGEYADRVQQLTEARLKDKNT